MLYTNYFYSNIAKSGLKILICTEVETEEQRD